MQVSSGLPHMLTSNQRGRGHEPVTVPGRVRVGCSGEHRKILVATAPPRILFAPCSGWSSPCAPRCWRRALLSRLRFCATDHALLEDLSKRSFMFFWEKAYMETGIVRDRARTDGSPVAGDARDVGSIASVGFALSGLCIAADRG